MTPREAPALPDRTPSSTGSPPPIRWVTAVERSSASDLVATALRPLSAVTSAEPLRSLLLGTTTGHALHPALTDLPIGFWTSAFVLDAWGGPGSRRAAQLLVGCGVLSAGPTALTGLAEWGETSRPESRVGAVHAALNVAALAGYAASWHLRRTGRHRSGVAVSLGPALLASVAGYLGGHLATARKVGSRADTYLVDGVGPVLERPGPV
ncbi:conserved hypothetical protein [Nostocoides japonicum T1-X7]|uniref:DUF2231 domain-containing protein n=1 Tax=Nostocoides japonicum T1-X7 TaxID=1194083 RepID=A0A077M0L1_9MICO|nr:DUF2231 domain-containing protein [Tetrasphaera japonica]CCH77724.1 conserved hypothetical protein [Tetrasphaera japonica T1-X7]